MPLFDALLKSDQYQVFLFACPATFPFSFARHPWFVVNKKGEMSRWEVLWFANKEKPGWGHIHKNRYPVFQGIEVFSFLPNYFWSEVELVGLVEGGEGSLAERMGTYIEDTPHLYYDLYRYSIPGINSITYAEWILNEFPDSGFRIKWNSSGMKM